MKVPNKSIFPASVIPAATVKNSAGGKAYALSDKNALAQIAVTNCFNDTFYTSAEQLLEMCKNVVQNLKGNPEFIAKTAIYCREYGNMKDMAAYLTVVIADLDTKLFHRVFDKVIDDGKMLRNFCQIARSGATGRVFNLSAGACRKAIQRWFDNHSADFIFRGSIGNDPSFRDILKMARPKPSDSTKDALFSYLIGNQEKIKERFENLPERVKQYENYKNGESYLVPNVDFRLLDSLNIGQSEWTIIARNAPWQTTRMNLNTFARHGVFENKEVSKIVADKLRNKQEVLNSRCFPYQLMTAYNATKGSPNIPHDVRDALQDAMEIATDNTPSMNGKIAICLDVSGSMSDPITGVRHGSTTSVRCIDVASLFASCLLRKNKDAKVLPFDLKVYPTSEINSRDSIMTNATMLAKYGGGGTNCATSLEYLNQVNFKADAVIFISDSESWVGSSRYDSGTKMSEEWRIFKKRNPNAKLVCIDLTPKTNSQVPSRQDTLLVGGFSDKVFDVVADFINNNGGKDFWTKEIEKIEV